MDITDAMHIEPEAAEHGSYRRIGTAQVCNYVRTAAYDPFDWSPVARPDYNWVAEWAVYGVRDGRLLVRYEGGHVQGTGHATGWREEPAIWVSAQAFSAVEIYGPHCRPDR